MMTAIEIMEYVLVSLKSKLNTHERLYAGIALKVSDLSEFSAAIKKLRDVYDFITDTWVNTVDGREPGYKITGQGVEALERFGSFAKYYEYTENERRDAEDHKRLTRKKAGFDWDMRNISFYFGAAALIISLATIIQTCAVNKDHEDLQQQIDALKR
jgi:hypothetical protein